MKQISKMRGCLAALAIFALAGTARSEELTKISIAMSSGSIPASTARIAKEMGLFEKHGLDASVKAMDNGSIGTMAVISGTLNFVTTAITDAVVSQSRGQDVVGLTTTYHGHAAVVVLSKSVVDKLKASANAPIGERLKALDGLTIASPSPTSTYTVSVRSAAEAAGAKVNFTYMSQPAMVAALQTGAIQGFIGGAPYYAQPVLNGSGVIWIAGPKGEFPPQFAPANATVLVTRHDYAVANPEIVKKVVAAFLDLGKAASERPMDVKAALARIYPDVDAKQLDLLFDTEVHGFMIGKLTVEEVQHDIDFMKTSGTDIPNIDRIKPQMLMFP